MREAIHSACNLQLDNGSFSNLVQSGGRTRKKSFIVLNFIILIELFVWQCIIIKASFRTIYILFFFVQKTYWAVRSTFLRNLSCRIACPLYQSRLCILLVRKGIGTREKKEKGEKKEGRRKFCFLFFFTLSCFSCLKACLDIGSCLLREGKK